MKKNNIIRRDDEAWAIAGRMRNKLFDMLKEEGGNHIPLRAPRNTDPLKHSMRSPDGTESADFPPYYFD